MQYINKLIPCSLIYHREEHHAAISSYHIKSNPAHPQSPCNMQKQNSSVQKHP